MISALNNWVVSYDNVSTIQPWFSDGLCRLSTGGGISERQLYTDGEEFVINAQRPVIINSIVDVATRPDLLDRSVVLTLEPIPNDKRRGEQEFWKEFEAAKPKIFGALLTALSCAVRRTPGITLPSQPRMADFAKWVTAAEPDLKWESGSFLKCYEGNQSETTGSLLETVVAQALMQFADQKPLWKGTPSDLYTSLTSSVKDVDRHGEWPGSANKLTGELRRIAPALRTAGYEIKDGRKSSGRWVSVEKLPPSKADPVVTDPVVTDRLVTDRLVTAALVLAV